MLNSSENNLKAQRINRPVVSEFIKNNILILITLLLLMLLSIVNSNVLRISNLQNILMQACYLVIFASAQMVVLLTRGFDLSLGATVSLVSVASALAIVNFDIDPGMQIAYGLLIAIAVSSLVGFVNGFAVAILKINPFVVTLATWNIIVTFSSTISDGFPVTGLPKELGNWFAGSYLFGFPTQIIITVLLVVVLAYILKYTVFGRSLFLIGANPRASFLGGIKVKPTLIGVYILCSILIGIGAFLLTARVGSGEPGLGGNLTMTSIAAAVIGGVSLRGGKGRIYSPVAGALFVTVFSNGMNMLRIDGSIQQIVLGLVIIIALIADRKGAI